ncbi:MAG: NAD(P)/FAD-dependent oxidoreductase [Mycobacteriales bacterium]
MADDRTFVIAGAGLAGTSAAATLREEGFEGRIVLLGRETERPYDRPPLSKGYLLGEAKRDSVFLHEPSWYDEQRIDLRLGTSATAIDPAARTVSTGDGTSVRYDALLLATGSQPRMLNVPGSDLDGVRYLRELAESEALQQSFRPGTHVIIAGAGWIGLEVAAAAQQKGASVVIAEPAELPLQRVLGDELGRIYAELHREKGVDLRLRHQIREIKGDGPNGTVSAVVLDDGSQLDADVVVVGVGVIPRVALAESAGLAVDGGVLVDAGFRSSDPNIFAAGDIAAIDHPVVGTRVRVEHWANALDGGPAAARSMLGQPVPWDKLPFFFSDQWDFSMEYAGYVAPGGYDEVVFRGDPAGREFVAFWTKDGRVLAGMNANVWDVSEDIQALIVSGAKVDRDRLSDADVAIADLAT